MNFIVEKKSSKIEKSEKRRRESEIGEKQDD